MTRDSTDRVASGENRASRRDFLASIAVTGVGLAGVGAVASAQEQEADVETFALGVTEAGWEGVAPAGIAGQTNPTLDLQAGRTYRVVWRNDDGRPHAFSILDEEGFEMPALRVLAATAGDVTVFDDPDANASETLTWANASTVRVGYLALQPGPAQDNATRAAVQDVPVVNETTNATGAGDELPLELIETSPVLTEQDAVQAVEFVADASMAAYVDPNFPGSAQGQLQVADGAAGNATTDGNVTDGNATADGNVTGDNVTADGNATMGDNATMDGNATAGGNTSG